MLTDAERNAIARAVFDPGGVLPRGDNYQEPIYMWQARAVIAALEVGELQTANTLSIDRGFIEGFIAAVLEPSHLTTSSVGYARALRAQIRNYDKELGLSYGDINRS